MSLFDCELSLYFCLSLFDSELLETGEKSLGGGCLEVELLTEV